jgi:acetylornithine deacetylase/succinyl-diaminopimelate desuccinylase-like protein
MTGASDSRFFGKLSDQCIRFLPYTIDAEQMELIHGVDEYVSIDTLVPAVDYYRYMYTHV